MALTKELIVNIIISAYNEEKNIDALINELYNACNVTNVLYSIIFVDDGSTDKTKEKVTSVIKSNDKSNINIKLVTYANNMGHEYAMRKGMESATGDIIIFLDADLQNPPSLLNIIIKEMQKGYDAIMMTKYPCCTIPKWKQISSRLYYKVFYLITGYKIIENASDFFAINKELCNRIINNYDYKFDFLRLVVQSEAKKVNTIMFHVPNRNAGESKYNFKKLFKLAIRSFSVGNLIKRHKKMLFNMK